MKKANNKIKISKELQEELQQLLEIPNIQSITQHLRRMFIDYLEYQLQTGVPVYFEEFLFPFNCLLDFLDIAITENTITTNKKD